MSKIVKLSVAEQVGMNFLQSVKKQRSVERKAVMPMTKSGKKECSLKRITSQEELQLVFRADSIKSVAKRIEEKKIVVKKKSKIKEEGEPCFYIFNAVKGGFVIVSAEENCDAILGYSDSGSININDIPPALEDILESYRMEILDIRERNIIADEKIKTRWKECKMSKSTIAKKRGGGKTREYNVADYDIIIHPLIKTKWSQYSPYNQNCPNHAVAGCVAIAMAQLMNYYAYPFYGRGERNGYNFERARYLYDKMNYETIYDNNAEASAAVATLVRHCGASVDMKYGKNSSDAKTEKGVSALHKYFKYNNVDFELDNRTPGGQLDKNWDKRLRKNLDNGQPIIYNGRQFFRKCKVAPEGHAFICDGYANNSLFHFNWGWGGAADGYYKTTNLNPKTGETHTYNRLPHAAFDLRPDTDIFFLTLCCNIKSMQDRLKDFVFPFGKVPVARGYARTFRLSVPSGYDVECIEYNGAFSKPNRENFTIYNVQKDGKINILLKPQNNFTVDGIIYKALSYDSAKVVGIESNITKIQIPQTVSCNGQSFYVVEIAEKAFKGKSNIKEINSGYVRKIGNSAFENCSSLLNISIKNAVEIGENICRGCLKLERAELASAVSIPTGAFSGCEKLNTLKSANIRSFGAKSFYNCKSLILNNNALNDARDIKESAFYGCEKLNVDISNGHLSSIEKEAFRKSGVKSLKLSCISSGVIGENAFRDCLKLTSVDLKSITKIENYAFGNCSSLLNISIKNAVEIGENICRGCLKLERAELASAVSIPTGAFSGCEKLNTLKSANIRSFGAKSFYNCKSLILNNNALNDARDIKESAFYGCEKLNVDISNGHLSSIEKEAFRKSGVKSLKLSCISSGVIGENAFRDCLKLTSVDLKSITKIENYAFGNCSSLTNAFLGRVDTVGDDAFVNCTKLEKVGIRQAVAIGNRAFSGCILKEIPLVEHLQFIGKEAFIKNPMDSIDFPDSVKNIGAFCFSECNKVTNIKIYTDNPPSCGARAFWGIDKNIPVYVPYNSINEYKSAPEWKDFKNYKTFEFEESGIKYRIISSGRTSVFGIIKEKLIKQNFSPFIGKPELLTIGEPKLPTPSACIKETTLQYKFCTVSQIEEKAFINAAYLKGVSIRSTKQIYIRKSAFEGCVGIKMIVLYSSQPHSLSSDVFKGMYKNGTLKHIELYVPVESKKTYETASVWKDFTIKGFIPESINFGDIIINTGDNTGDNIIDFKPDIIDEVLLEEIKIEAFLANIHDDIKINWERFLDIIKEHTITINEFFDDINTLPAGLKLNFPKDIEYEYQGVPVRQSLILKKGIEALKTFDTFTTKNIDIIKDSLEFNGKKISIFEKELQKTLVLKKTMRRQTEKPSSAKKMPENGLDQYFSRLRFNIQLFKRLMESQKKIYYISRRAQKSGDHEMHVLGCNYMPSEKNARLLGVFFSEEKALEAAREIYPESDGCYYCCKKTDTDRNK